ncbi:carboxypeptidase-like regulatory domain-containing protein [Gemmatimonadota bacterium]
MRSRRPYAAFGFPGWRGVPFLFLLSFLALLAPPTPIHGQVVRGHLLDNETRQPIISGAVALMDSLGGAVARTLTNEEGAFELTAPEPGMYTLMAAGMGYRSTPSGRLDLINNQLITIDMHLLPKPLRLEPIMVTAERIRAELARQGFYDRRDSGRGFFVSPEEIRRRPPHQRVGGDPPGPVRIYESRPGGKRHDNEGHGGHLHPHPLRGRMGDLLVSRPGGNRGGLGELLRDHRGGGFQRVCRNPPGLGSMDQRLRPGPGLDQVE